LANTNLKFTTITSPIDGTILARRVSIGQTVVSSLNAPSLFLIARDLRRMQVWASVNEADIGRLKVGTEVNFRVDAFPNDVFRGEVVQIRLNASMTQNVVTYTVVISTDNSNLKLLPYLSADVKFEVDKRTDALLVPNAALRYQPRAEQMDKVATDAAKAMAKPPVEGQTWSTLWIKQDDSPLLAPLRVRTGLSDGVNTEIVEGELDEKSQIVLGEKRAQETTAEVNPFAPPRFRGSPKKK
jgi:HlyD family secretion protein